jgi:hypothetical protein
MSAPSGTQVQQGWTKSDTVGSSDIPACSLVTKTSGLLVVCGSGDKPQGVTGGEVLTKNLMGSYYAWVPGQRYYVVTTGSPAINEHLKCGASGVAVVETSASTITAFTIGKQDSAVDANGGAFVQAL